MQRSLWKQYGVLKAEQLFKDSTNQAKIFDKRRKNIGRILGARVNILLVTFKNTPNDSQFGSKGIKMITSFWSDEPEDKDESMRPRSSRGPRIFCMCFQVPSWKLH
jgi:hypothetical protein